MREIGRERERESRRDRYKRGGLWEKKSVREKECEIERECESDGEAGRVREVETERGGGGGLPYDHGSAATPVLRDKSLKLSSHLIPMILGEREGEPVIGFYLHQTPNQFYIDKKQWIASVATVKKIPNE